VYDRKKLATQMISEEDERLRLYPDSKGKLTIGIGRNVEDRGISKDESRYLFWNDIAAVEDVLNKHCLWWKTLDDVRARVLISMCFNLGEQEFLLFRHFLAAAEQGDWERAALEMIDSQWYGEVGVRGPKLVRWMRTGVEA
jgi:lysozyme